MSDVRRECGIAMLNYKERTPVVTNADRIRASMICECYRAEKNFLGKVGVCWGTRERDACSCGGDKSKCDFYPSVREEGKKPMTHFDEIKAMGAEEMAARLAKHNERSAVCPNFGAHDCQASCRKCWLDWLKSPADKEES
jgi:hypothetical protein